MKPVPIKVTVTFQEESSEGQSSKSTNDPRKALSTDDPREAFWRRMDDRRSYAPSGQDFESWMRACEHAVTCELGDKLRENLVEFIGLPLRKMRDQIIRNDQSRRLVDLFWMEKENDTQIAKTSAIEAMMRQEEQVMMALRETQTAQAVDARLSLATMLSFSVRIVGYRSMHLEILPSSYKLLAEICNHDITLLQYLCQSLIPKSFGQLSPVNSQLGDVLFNVETPPDSEVGFSKSEKETSAKSKSLPAMSKKGWDKETWLWVVANHSLLLPVLLSLIVCYIGLGILREIGQAQKDAIKPVLEHQLELLKEDRMRMYRDSASPSRLLDGQAPGAQVRPAEPVGGQPPPLPSPSK
jgi:hypothetical protein